MPPNLNRQQQRNFENRYVGQKRYLQGLVRVGTASAGIKAAGIDWPTLRRWREVDVEFIVREQAARDQIADKLEQEAIRRAVRGTKKAVYQGGLLAGYVTEFSDQLLVTMLKATRPERFRDRSDITVNPIMKVVAGLDPAEVL